MHGFVFVIYQYYFAMIHSIAMNIHCNFSIKYFQRKAYCIWKQQCLNPSNLSFPEELFLCGNGAWLM